MSVNQLWVESYRPRVIDDYVFTDQELKQQIEHWINQGTIPHLLIHGPSGTGKTTLAKILINQLNINNIDVLYANGSKEGRRIEWVDKLISFCQTMPFGSFKIVLIDEADYLNKDSVQPAMRNLMEDYNQSVRFILTCNYPNRIIPPLHSRCTSLQIDKSDQAEFTARVATILLNEHVDFDLDTLDSYVKATYPDLRKCLNLVQSNSISGKLTQPRESDTTHLDYRLSAVDLFKKGQIRQARQLICNSVRPEEMEELFRWSYDNLDLWGSTEEEQDQAILVIRRGLVNHASCADSEINLSATLVELCGIKNKGI